MPLYPPASTTSGSPGISDVTLLGWYDLGGVGAGGLQVQIPDAVTAVFPGRRLDVELDLTGFTQARLLGYIKTGGAGSATSKLRLQYSLNNVDWAYLDGVSGPSVSCAAAGYIVSVWVDLIAAAKAAIYLRAVGLDGGNFFVTFNALRAQFL